MSIDINSTAVLGLKVLDRKFEYPYGISKNADGYLFAKTYTVYKVSGFFIICLESIQSRLYGHTIFYNQEGFHEYKNLDFTKTIEKFEHFKKLAIEHDLWDENYFGIWTIARGY